MYFRESMTFQAEVSYLPASAGFLLGLLFDPEDGGDMLL
jgi:hypothetical protein